MSFTGMISKNNRVYLFADNSQYLNTSVMHNESKRRYRIQRFKNFVIGYDGSSLEFQKFMERFDVDSFPEPLDEDFIYHQFYPDFRDFLVEQCKCECKQGALMNAEFQLFIVGKNYAYNICDSYPYKAKMDNDFYQGGDSDAACFLYPHLKERMDGEELVHQLIKKSVQICSHVTYPFLLVDNQNLDEIQIIRADGSIEKKPLKAIWEK